MAWRAGCRQSGSLRATERRRSAKSDRFCGISIKAVMRVMASSAATPSRQLTGDALLAASVDHERASPSTAPCVGCLADYPLETAREMRLIAHAAPDGDRAERFGRRQHQPLRHLDAPAQHIVARRYTKRTFERTAEVAGAEANEPRELLNVNPSG